MWLLVAVLGVTGNPTSAAMPPDFEKLLEQALKIREKPAVAQYTWQFLQAHGTQFSTLMSDCNKTHAMPVGEKLQLVMRITAEGAADAVMASPDGDFSQCVASGLTAFRFAPPPRQFARSGLPWLLEVSLTGKKSSG